MSWDLIMGDCGGNVLGCLLRSGRREMYVCEWGFVGLWEHVPSLTSCATSPLDERPNSKIRLCLGLVNFSLPSLHPLALSASASAPRTLGGPCRTHPRFLHQSGSFDVCPRLLAPRTQHARLHSNTNQGSGSPRHLHPDYAFCLPAHPRSCACRTYSNTHHLTVNRSRRIQHTSKGRLTIAAAEISSPPRVSFHPLSISTTTPGVRYPPKYALPHFARSGMQGDLEVLPRY